MAIDTQSPTYARKIDGKGRTIEETDVPDLPADPRGNGFQYAARGSAKVAGDTWVDARVAMFRILGREYPPSAPGGPPVRHGVHSLEAEYLRPPSATGARLRGIGPRQEVFGRDLARRLTVAVQAKLVAAGWRPIDDARSGDAYQLWQAPWGPAKDLEAHRLEAIEPVIRAARDALDAMIGDLAVPDGRDYEHEIPDLSGAVWIVAGRRLDGGFEVSVRISQRAAGMAVEP
jgi:hypothetical protein